MKPGSLLRAKAKPVSLFVGHDGCTARGYSILDGEHVTSIKTAALAALLLSGCLTHLPPAGHTHMQIHWAAGYEAAAREAAAHQKPLLVCLVAGELDGLC